MYALTLKGDVLGRGSREVMSAMREQLARFTGRDISEYRIEAI
jgi:hypothetical protein